MKKKKQLPRVYWDSSCFIAWLKPEKKRRLQCQEVIQAAKRGELEIVTSALSLAEVVKLDKGPLQVPAEKASLITGFFQYPWIVVVQLNRSLAEQARLLIWEHGLKPRDAIHAATALHGIEDGGVVEMHAFDGDLLGLDDKGILKVKEPRAIQALILVDEDPGEESGAPPTPASDASGDEKVN